ncbi:DUF6402 family protein [Glacieibacterium megasporae]|uniref:DUF6402 family protein n=1 Tax=Glacieibacterium megasporae TaxID=2835787 RepID=UPI0034E22299
MMDRWFNGDAWTMTIPEKRGEVSIATISGDKIDTRHATMRWASGFGRFTSAQHHLLNSWSTPPRLERGVNRLSEQFRAWFLSTPLIGRVVSASATLVPRSRRSKRRVR